MTICDELRQAVLQAAIQGKLTEQREEDGTAEELLEEIRKEKERLIVQGKIKKEKKLPKIDDVPFDIPDNWKWVRFGSCISLLSGTDYPPDQYNDKGIGTPYMTGASNIEDHNLVINRWTENPKCIAKKGDLLIVCKGSGYGKSVISNIEYCHIARQFMAISHSMNLCQDYCKIFVDNSFSLIKTKGQGVIPGIDRNVILSLEFPLPPLAEQHRIVERVNTLMKKIDALQTIEDELQSLKQAFPGNMRDAILQAAMQGKLTEQLDSDGTAEELLEEIKKEKERLIKEGKIKREKTLPEISEDEIPFDIPENWKWVRLGLISTYNQTKMKVNAKNLDSETWLLDLEDIEKGGKLLIRRTYSENKSIGEKTIFKKGNILYSKLRPYLLKILVADEDGACSPELVPFSCYGKISSDYVVSILKSPYVDNTINQATYGMKMPRVGTPTMVNLVLPLPPLAEQHRIVARLNELLPLCDTLEEAK